MDLKLRFPSKGGKMRPAIKTLLLIALPASGKSEARKCLKHAFTPEEFAKLGIGETVDLDDYPYVEFERLVDVVCRNLGWSDIFFDGPDGGFIDPLEWLVLIELLNEDFQDLTKPRPQITSREVVEDLFERFDRAGRKVGMAPRLAKLSDHGRELLIDAILDEVANPEGMSAAKRLVKEPYFWRVDNLDGRTVVIEFSRGIPKDSSLPPEFPFGYTHSLAQLSPEILETASVLYIWVTLEDSIRKDKARNVKSGDSTMNHGLSDVVREGAYWGDDFDSMGGHRGRLLILGGGCRPLVLPTAVFDNTGVGCTDVFRRKPETWTPEEISSAKAKLQTAFAQLKVLR